MTGIAGTESIGLSYHQVAWRLYNEAEELKLKSEAEFDTALFMVSAIAPKEVERIRTRLTLRRQEEEERKQRIIAGEVGITRFDQINEVIDQLEHDMAGRSDDFDRVVNLHEQSYLLSRIRKELSELAYAEKIDRDAGIVSDINLETLAQQIVENHYLNIPASSNRQKLTKEQINTVVKQIRKETNDALGDL